MYTFFFLHFSFDGRVVAKLPFVPLSYIQGLSHRNLLGEDYTECSFIFLYILCTMSIRQVMLILCVNGARSIMQWQFWGKSLGFGTVHLCNTCPNLFNWILVVSEYPEDVGSRPLPCRHQTGWRVFRTSSTSCQVFMNICRQWDTYLKRSDTQLYTLWTALSVRDW